MNDWTLFCLPNVVIFSMIVASVMIHDNHSKSNAKTKEPLQEYWMVFYGKVSNRHAKTKSLTKRYRMVK